MKLKASIAAAVAALAVAGLVALNAGASEKAPAAAGQAPAAVHKTEIPDPNAGYPDGGKPDPAAAGGWYLSPDQGN